MPPKNPNNIPDITDPPKDADVVFVLDATGSQQPYINNVRQYVNGILEPIRALHPLGKTRFRVITFRDHIEQGDAQAVMENPFRANSGEIGTDLARIVAKGGGDGPEAQIDALEKAADSAWTPGAAKSVILITDSPPHGVLGNPFPPSHVREHPGLTGDSIQARYVRDKIALKVIGCEPTIKSYPGAVDWYDQFCRKTGPKYAALPTATLTSRALTASALEAIDTHRIAGRWEDWIMDNSHRGADAIARDMHSHLSSEGEKCVDIKCARYGGSDFSYSVGPITRARVDEIVNRSLVYKATASSGYDVSDIFG